jgi:hypothetical protein
MKKSDPKNRKNRPIEVISLDVDEEGETPADFDLETTLDLLEDALEDNYAVEVARHTDDPEIQESFEERQDHDAGHRQLEERLQENLSESPILSGGDIDAAWDESDVGEETVGGKTPTPDQDVVDELGEAVGLTYEDDEPLNTADKLAKRDHDRWELDPESAEEEPA